ncbi:hypothetical protein F2Q70_00042551 [Brassica cretica]|uniref:Uncharacterized protein n=1 Tax=Brassica cretica TaxID=69181 RepID=A0A8S9KLE6_BRACR|nr:hypothetical protein F2Q70_00042551 [Brassica cretica]
MEHSSDLTVEAMMLDSKASDLDKEERPENDFLKRVWFLTESFLLFFIFVEVEEEERESMAKNQKQLRDFYY